MKHRYVVPALIVCLAALSTMASAQMTGSVRGVCKDLEGKVIAGATVELVNSDTGRKYDLKTNAKGEFFSLGIEPGKYRAALLQDGKEVFHFNNFQVAVGENPLDFDLQKEAAGAVQGQGLTPEQKQKQEQASKANKENATIKQLNEKIIAAKTASDAGDFDTAIASLNEANQIDATHDLIWGKLGDAYSNSAGKQTDPAEKNKRYDQAVADYQKAIELKQKAVDAAPQKSPDANKQLAQYSNQLGQAYAKSGKTDDAVKAYTHAAELDPAAAGQYYYNLGAIMTNANVTNDPKQRQAAVEAFDKAIAADPNRADAYYWKATNLIGAATLKGDKMIAPDGTAEAFQKYLELQPTGPHAEEAKAMLASIGGTVETDFGKKKSSKK